MSVESNPELHFFSLRSVIGSGYLRHFLNQSDAKLKQNFPALKAVWLFSLWVLIGS